MDHELSGLCAGHGMGGAATADAIAPGGGSAGMTAPLPTLVVTASLFLPVQPQNQAEVLSIVNTIAERMRRSPNCCRNRLLRDLDDPNAFVLVSEWPDMASVEAFMLSRELQIFRGVRMLLRSEPVVILDQISNRLTRVLSTD